ncbi:ATP-binding cassette domain-containing protein [Terriglobus sp. RCC_193]|uniref:ATP-binding cassette domain-containing protein n=1 Tax=Terriglobus sp. RCC_193 TaxID=3239218 RepID=UPI003525DC44
MNGAAIEFRDVTVDAAPSRKHSGEGVAILNSISLRLEAGTTTALLGRSGSGKTTLLRTINGLVSPTSGTVLIDGEVVGAGDLLALRRRIGYVIQETGLYPHLTIERNVAMPLELAGTPLTERQLRVRELLAMTGLDPAKFAERMPWQVSGGQRQRAGVARALAADPSILLLDEPFGALDPLTRAEMQTMLRDLLTKLQETAVIVTHDLQEAVFLADRILLLDKGSIVADLPSREVLHSQIPAVKEYVAAVQRFTEAES